MTVCIDRRSVTLCHLREQKDFQCCRVSLSSERKMFAKSAVIPALKCANSKSIQRMASSTGAAAAPLSQYWMPFTDNVNFKKKPKVFSRAEGTYYYTEDGRKVLDAMSGLWCVNAGHGQKKIVEAIKNQADKMCFAPSFNSSHTLPGVFAEKITALLPGLGFKEVFFSMCGSTAVDSAMKIALQYHRAKGKAARTRFIGRERAYHGVGFGGISVGGISTNRKAFSGSLLPNVDHIAHTYNHSEQAYTKGQPAWGAHLAEDLERVIALHDADTIAAVFIEPVAGSTGVLPPPVGYLERIREICTKHDIPLVFDEVITGFGRLGAPFATVKFGVTPDMITCAKGLTNAAVPCGAVICQGKLFDTIQQSVHQAAGTQIEFFHGYTYSGHPLAMAAGIASLEVFEEQQLFQRANDLSPYFQECLHSGIKGLPNVIDIRSIGMMGAVEFAPSAGHKRPFDVYDRCFEKGVFARAAGPQVVLSPSLVSTKQDIDRIIDTLRESIKESAAAF